MSEEASLQGEGGSRWLTNERAVLGSLIQDSNAWAHVDDGLRGSDFVGRGHDTLFATLKSMYDAGLDVDALTLHDRLSADGTLEQVGGGDLIQSILDSPFSPSSIITYVSLMRRDAALRALHKAATSMTELASKPGARGPEEIADSAQKHVHELVKIASGRGHPHPIGEILDDTIRWMNDRKATRSGLPGLTTGFGLLDRMTQGLQRGDLIIVAGRPSMGKTSLAMNITENALQRGLDLRGGHSPRVLVFSMEMSRRSLAMRMLSSIGRVEHSKIRSGYYSKDENEYINRASDSMRDWNLFIDDSTALTPSTMGLRARLLEHSHGPLDLLVVDYLQLMSADGDHNNRVAETTAISAGLKALARDLDIPVLALSQLSRASERRDSDPRPQLSDLRDSGSIEQDADLVMFIDRPEMRRKSKAEELLADNSGDDLHGGFAKGEANIIIAKQRNGPTGTVKLTFLKEHSRFEDAEPLHEPAGAAMQPEPDYGDGP